MKKGKTHAKRSTEVPSSSAQPQQQRRRSDVIIAPPSGIQELPARFFPSPDHRLRFYERFHARPVHHGKDVNAHLMNEVGVWTLELGQNGVTVMHSLLPQVCELAVRLFFCNLTDYFDGRRYHIGFKYKKSQKRNNVFYSNVFGQHIELSRDLLGEILAVTPGGLDYNEATSYNMREFCSNLFGSQYDFSTGDWLEIAADLGVNALSPLGWVLHVWVINNYSPRQARSRMTAEEIWILGALMGNVKINYPLWVFDLFRKASSHSTFTLPLGRLVTHILGRFNIEFPPGSLTDKHIDEFSDANLKKAGFKRILYPSGAARWIRKTAAPPPENSDDEATADEQDFEQGGDLPMEDQAPHPSAPPPVSLDDLMGQLTSLTTQVSDWRQEQHQDNLYTRGMIHQLSRDVYGLYHDRGLDYPPPYEFPPPGFYPPAPPPDFPYPYPYPYPPPPPPPPTDD